MASRYEVELTLSSAKDLKNVNWRYGPIKPYAVIWVDPTRKVSSRVDEDGDTSPQWDQTLVIPLDRPIEDSTLHIDVVHAYAAEDTKPLIGSCKLPLKDVVDDAGIGGRTTRSLKLKRPSGRPHGKIEIDVVVRHPRYHAPDPYTVPPYGVSRDVVYGGAPYPQPTYAQPSYPQPSYPQPTYAQPSYEQPSYTRAGVPGYGYPEEEKKKSKFGGMGTGLAVGAVAGALGGLALAEGFDKFEDHVAEEAAERVEDDLEDGNFDDGDYDEW